MTTEEWQELYKKLDDIHYKFSMEYREYQHGKNKKIRDAAEREIKLLIFLASQYIRKHREAYELLTGGPNVDDYGRAIAYDEFVMYRYFGDDLRDFLKKIQERIQPATEI